jgi:AcrR family transcriptional regulator
VPTTDQSTRDAILDAAERLFGRQGFAATTIKQIGAEAGVNTALLYYYFEDKLALYRAALERVFGGLSGGAQQLDPALPPAAQVERFVGYIVQLLATHPQMPRLLVRELIDYEAAHAEEAIAQIAANVFKRLCDVIETGQRTGVFRAELDPRFAAISTIGQVAYFFIARPAIGRLLGEGRHGPAAETVGAYGRHAAAFALAALTDPDAPRTAGRSTGARI